MPKRSVMRRKLIIRKELNTTVLKMTIYIYRNENLGEEESCE
jgi:hypothetical protein